jgi:hypothetical protein
MTRPLLSGLIYAGRLTWLALFLAASAGALVFAFRAFSEGYFGMFAVLLAVSALSYGIVHVVQRACE